MPFTCILCGWQCYAVDVYDEFEYIVGTVMISTVTFLAIMFKAMMCAPTPITRALSLCRGSCLEKSREVM